MIFLVIGWVWFGENLKNEISICINPYFDVLQRKNCEIFLEKVSVWSFLSPLLTGPTLILGDAIDELELIFQYFLKYIIVDDHGYMTCRFLASCNVRPHHSVTGTVSIV